MIWGHKLTHRQLALLRWIAGYIETFCQSPTYDQMAEGVGLFNRGHAHAMVARLVERGAVEREIPQRGTVPRWGGQWLRARLRLVNPPPIPRAPDGAPLFAVPLPYFLSPAFIQGYAPDA